MLITYKSIILNSLIIFFFVILNIHQYFNNVIFIPLKFLVGMDPLGAYCEEHWIHIGMGILALLFFRKIKIIESMGCIWFVSAGAFLLLFLLSLFIYCCYNTNKRVYHLLYIYYFILHSYYYSYYHCSYFVVTVFIVLWLLFSLISVLFLIVLLQYL